MSLLFILVLYYTIDHLNYFLNLVNTLQLRGTQCIFEPAIDTAIQVILKEYSFLEFYKQQLRNFSKILQKCI